MNDHDLINRGKVAYHIPATNRSGLPFYFLEVHVTEVIVPECRPVLNLLKLEAGGNPALDIFLSSDAIVIAGISSPKTCSFDFDKLK
jgi:hypothetical protein